MSWRGREGETQAFAVTADAVLVPVDRGGQVKGYVKRRGERGEGRGERGEGRGERGEGRGERGEGTEGDEDREEGSKERGSGEVR